MRFSLRWLFGLVAFVAVGCLSLIYASEPISMLLGAVLFGFLTTAVLGAIFEGRSRRRFWAGCAIAGFIYIATAYLPQYPGNIRLPRSTTGEILDWLHQKIVRQVQVEASARGRLIRAIDLPQNGPFHAAGQSLAVFVWAIAGGIVAGRFSRDE